MPPITKGFRCQFLFLIPNKILLVVKLHILILKMMLFITLVSPFLSLLQIIFILAFGPLNLIAGRSSFLLISGWCFLLLFFLFLAIWFFLWRRAYVTLVFMNRERK